MDEHTNYVTQQFGTNEKKFLETLHYPIHSNSIKAEPIIGGNGETWPTQSVTSGHEMNYVSAGYISTSQIIRDTNLHHPPYAHDAPVKNPRTENPLNQTTTIKRRQRHRRRRGADKGRTLELVCGLQEKNKKSRWLECVNLRTFSLFFQRKKMHQLSISLWLWGELSRSTSYY